MPSVRDYGVVFGAAAEMAQIATLIARALRGRADDAAIARVRADVRALCNEFVPYPR